MSRKILYTKKEQVVSIIFVNCQTKTLKWKYPYASFTFCEDNL